jgi:hypothetical protein
MQCPQQEESLGNDKNRHGRQSSRLADSLHDSFREKGSMRYEHQVIRETAARRSTGRT